MKKFWFEFGNMYGMSEKPTSEPGDSGPYYLASDLAARIAELAAKWETEIAVAYNEYSHGQRAAFEQAAAELRSLMER